MVHVRKQHRIHITISSHNSSWDMELCQGCTSKRNMTKKTIVLLLYMIITLKKWIKWNLVEMLKSVLILTSNKTVKYLMLSRLFEFCWSFYNLFVLINSPLSQGKRNTFYSYIKIIELVKNIFLLLLVSCLKSNNNFGPFETFVLGKTIWVWAEMFLQVQQTQLLSNFSYNKLKQNFLLQQDQQ